MPAILFRTPYGKSALQPPLAIHAAQAAEAGFAVVFQDTRGRFGSEGDFYPLRHEGADGYDTVEWVAARPWCSGAIGMSGPSYLGATQWLAAIEQPPHLRAIFPAVTSSEFYEGWTYQGGAFQIGFVLFWTMLRIPETLTRWARAGNADLDDVMRAILASDQVDEHYRHLPLSEQLPLRLTEAVPYYFD